MSSSLTEIVLPQRPSAMPCPTTVTDGDRRSLFIALEAVDDPRDPRGRRYPLVGILAAAVCAVIAGACTFAAVTDWVRFQDRTVWARLGFDGRIPAATTVWRLLIRVDAEVLSQVLARWLRSRTAPVLAAGRWWRLVIAVDGKVERGARLSDGRQVHLLAAYDTSTGIVLRIFVGDECVTLVEDQDSKSSRRAIACSLYPLAEWIAYNWWFLQADTRPISAISALRSGKNIPGSQRHRQRH